MWEAPATTHGRSGAEVAVAEPAPDELTQLVGHAVLHLDFFKIEIIILKI